MFRKLRSNQSWSCANPLPGQASNATENPQLSHRNDKSRSDREKMWGLTAKFNRAAKIWWSENARTSFPCFAVESPL
jgi:hypothetical protein